MRRNPRTFTWRRCCDRQLLAVVVPGSEPGWLNVKDRTMDGLARYNRARWEELACTNVEYSQPYLDLDSSSARGIVDQHGLLGDVAGRKVLCLASGGGQQSAAFGLLEAQVTVLDLSETQLQRDRQAAEHYGLDVRTIQGDMRDLSALSSDEFDIVWQPYSINFVPSVVPVFQEVARVVRPGGRYMVEFANPFTHFAVDEDAWDGKGYPLKYPYTDGEEVTGLNPDWRYWDVQTEGGKWVKVESPREFRHTLGTLINGLAREGFVILGAWEDASGDQNAKPGTWEHLKSIAPPWLSLWTTYRPDGDGRDTTRLRSGTPEKWMGQAEACTGDRLATDGSDAGAG
jgi:SAM-dependent methyltransferase